MAARIGEMMVVIRAQDFASRTLHKVSGELAGMSKAQAMAARGKAVENQMRLAKSYVATAEANMQALKQVQAYRTAINEQTVAFRKLQSAQSALTSAQGARAKAIRSAQQELAVARQELDFFRRAREVAGRKVISPAQRVAGMEAASRRIESAHQALAQAARSLPGGTAITQLERRVSDLSAAYNAATNRVSRYGQAISKLPGWLRSAATSQYAFNSATMKANRELETAYNNLGKAEQAQIAYNNALKMMPMQRVSDLGRALSGIGRTMQLVGGIATGIFALSANSFANFSESAATAATQMRDIGAPMEQAVMRSKQLQEQILKMAMVFPASADDMTKAAYDIYSSMNLMHNGVMNVTGGLKLLAVANKIAVAGQVDLASATNAMIVALNTFDPTLSDVTGTMDTMMNIVRYGKLRVDDLSKAFTSFSAVAKSSGLALADVGGAFATLTLFMESDRAGAGLGRLIEIFRNPVFKTGFKNMGIDVEKASGKLRPLQDIINDIAKKRPDLISGQTSALQFFIQVSKASGMTKAGIQGTIQARRAFEQLITHMVTYNEVVGEVTKNKNELDNAFRARMVDPGVQWAIFKNQMKALVLIIGREALPVFLMIGNAVARFIAWLQNMNSATRGSLVRIATLISVFTLLGGIGLAIAGSLLQVYSHLMMIRMASILAAQAGDQAASSFIRLRTVLMSGVLIALFLVTQHLFGFKKAIIITAAAWGLWKVRAIQAIGAVVIAAVTGAEITATAWREALVATGWGAFVVAAGVAAVYVMNNWDKVRAYFKAWQMDVGAGFHSLWHTVVLDAEHAGGTIARIMGKLTGSKTVENWGKQLQEHANKGLAGVGDTFTKNYNIALAKIRKQNKRKDPFGFDFMKRVGKLTAGLMSADDRKAIDDWANSIGDSTGEAAKLAKLHTNAIQEATKNMTATVKTATDNLVQQYETLQSANQSALGGLFQGPTMSGILGNVFSGINSTLRQFGIQLAIPGNILKQDLDQQIMYFKQWTTDINKLAKRVGPKNFKFVQQIQAMGPEQGGPILAGLLQLPRGAFNALLKEWKTGQKLIGAQTQKDMKYQLAYWNTFGKDAAFQTIMGIIHSPENGHIRDMYRNYVKNTYGAILKDQYNKDVQAAIKQGKEDMAAAATQTKIPKFPTTTGGKTGNKGAGKGGKQLTVADLHFNTRIARFDKLETMYARAATTSPYFKKKLAQTQAAEHRLRVQRRNVLQAERKSIKQQIIAQEKKHPNWDYVNVTYAGDTVTIHADGATPAAVNQAMKKLAFKHKHKNKSKAKG